MEKDKKYRITADRTSEHAEPLKAVPIDSEWYFVNEGHPQYKPYMTKSVVQRVEVYRRYKYETTKLWELMQQLVWTGSSEPVFIRRSAKEMTVTITPAMRNYLMKEYDGRWTLNMIGRDLYRRMRTEQPDQVALDEKNKKQEAKYLRALELQNKAAALWHNMQIEKDLEVL